MEIPSIYPVTPAGRRRRESHSAVAKTLQHSSKNRRQSKAKPLNERPTSSAGFRVAGPLSTQGRPWLDSFTLTSIHSSFNRRQRVVPPKPELEKCNPLPGQQGSDALTPRIVRKTPS